MLREIWRDINGYEGIYQVSNLGRVKSLERRVRNHESGSTRLVTENMLNSHDNGKGYQVVFLSKQGKRARPYIHRLVAEAFIPNPDNKEQVNHLDYNRANNSADNLEWCTAKENTLYSVERMRKPKSNCEKMHRPKIHSKPTSTGHRYIGKRGEFFRVHITAINIDRRFKTLDEAIKYRDKVVQEKGWQNRSYKRTRRDALSVE